MFGQLVAAYSDTLDEGVCAAAVKTLAAKALNTIERDVREGRTWEAEVAKSKQADADLLGQLLAATNRPLGDDDDGEVN